MKVAKLPGKCPNCSEKLIVEVNLFTSDMKIMLEAKPAGFGMKMRVVDHYKKLKGLDKVTTWDAAYRPRALKAVGKVLHVFRKLEDPAGVAIELINETEDQARRKDWAGWNLDSCAKRAGEWLAEKQKEPRRRR